MPHLDVTAVASGRLGLNQSSILISVTNSETGMPQAGSLAFDIRFGFLPAHKAEIYSHGEWLPGIHQLGLDWGDYSFPRGFHQLAVRVRQGPPRQRGAKFDIQGQTVCHLAVEPSE